MWRLSLLELPTLGPMLLWLRPYVGWSSILCFPRYSSDTDLDLHRRLCHRQMGGSGPSSSNSGLRHAASSSFLHFLPKFCGVSVSTQRRKRGRWTARPNFGTKMRMHWRNAGIQLRRCGTSHAFLTNSIVRSACRILGKCGGRHACTTSSSDRRIGIHMEHHCVRCRCASYLLSCVVGLSHPNYPCEVLNIPEEVAKCSGGTHSSLVKSSTIRIVFRTLSMRRAPPICRACSSLGTSTHTFA